jgi:ABC-type glycerol-3-phosphate transport system substrate-binding protein
LLDQAIANGIPAGELRYTSYFNTAVNDVVRNGTQPKDALQAAEQQAVTEQQAAIAKKDDNQVYVEPPPAEAVLTAGEIAIDFGLVTTLSNEDKNRWEQVIKEFVDADTQVGQINFKSGFTGINDAATTYDCFYMAFNDLASADTSKLLNLDPFVSADAAFDKNDFVGNTLEQGRKEGRLYALPIMLEPNGLKYDSQLFAERNITAPASQWTITDFTDAVKRLRDNLAEDEYPLAANAPGGAYLLSLIAAYGGVPIDFRTSPPTLSFTDATNAGAIRQVLDLAKDKLIEYEKLGDSSFGGPTRIRAGGDAPVYTVSLNAFEIQIAQGQGVNDPYRLTSYPRGTSYAALAYTMGVGLISATAENPDACYRWLTEVSKHPELHNAMPARRSSITSAAKDAETAAFYNAVDATLSDPNTIPLPSQFGGGGSATSYLQTWLYRAFDKYVLEDGDLDVALKEAEDLAKAYQECTAAIPPYDPATQTRQDYDRQFTACATKIDSTITGQ